MKSNTKSISRIFFSDHLRPNPHEFGRPPVHGGHPSMHMRNEQGKLFYGEEGKQARRTIDRDLKVCTFYHIYIAMYLVLIDKLVIE